MARLSAPGRDFWRLSLSLSLSLMAAVQLDVSLAGGWIIHS